MERSNFIDYNNLNFRIIVRARIVNDNLLLTFFNEFEETLEKNEMNLILFHSIKQNQSFIEINNLDFINKQFIESFCLKNKMISINNLNININLGCLNNLINSNFFKQSSKNEWTSVDPLRVARFMYVLWVENPNMKYPEKSTPTCRENNMTYTGENKKSNGISR